jgi:hypothetical protein
MVTRRSPGTLCVEFIARFAHLFSCRRRRRRRRAEHVTSESEGRIFHNKSVIREMEERKRERRE